MRGVVMGVCNQPINLDIMFYKN
jgi:hypothetical protein